MSYTFHYNEYLQQLISLFTEIESEPELSSARLRQLLTKYPKKNGELFRKGELVTASGACRLAWVAAVGSPVTASDSDEADQNNLRCYAGHSLNQAVPLSRQVYFLSK